MIFIHLYTQLIDLLVSIFNNEARINKQKESYLNQSTSIYDLERRYKKLGM